MNKKKIKNYSTSSTNRAQSSTTFSFFVRKKSGANFSPKYCFAYKIWSYDFFFIFFSSTNSTNRAQPSTTFCFFITKKSEANFFKKKKFVLFIKPKVINLKKIKIIAQVAQIGHNPAQPFVFSSCKKVGLTSSQNVVLLIK